MRQHLSLRPYQQALREFAHETRFCGLWADLGLGKTPTALQVIEDSLRDYYDTERWLVVAPRLVALDAWPRQIRMWDQFSRLSFRNIRSADLGLKALIDNQTGRRCGLTFGEREDKRAVKKHLQSMREEVHICSWDAFPWLVRAYGANWPYDGLVLDEAVFAANSTSARHKAAYQVIHRLGAVRRLIELTGKPTPNGYEQLHGQVRLLDPDRLGSTKTEFQRRWMMPIQLGTFTKWVMRPDARPLIDKELDGLCVSLKSEDYLQLPPMLVNRIEVELPAQAREHYERLLGDLVTDVGDAEILAPSQAALGGKLMQLCNGAVYDQAGAFHEVHNAKLDRLEEVLDSVQGPVLLAYNFEHDWQRIRRRFRAAVNVADRGALDRFRAGKVKLMCMHPASGAHGLDGLQDASSTAVWFGATYNADHWMQFNKRLHRNGQQADRVTVHQLLARDSIEEYVNDSRLAEKLDEQEKLLAAVKLAISSRQSVTHGNALH